MNQTDLNLQTLDSFVEYCRQHPEYRFWQAVRNWSQFSFVLVADESNHEDIEDIHDTFYFKGKNS